MVLYKMGLVPPTSPEISDKSHEIPMFLGGITISHGFPMVFPWLSHGFHRTWTVGSPPCLGGPRGRAAPAADAPREQCEAANASVASKEKA